MIENRVQLISTPMGTTPAFKAIVYAPLTDGFVALGEDGRVYAALFDNNNSAFISGWRLVSNELFGAIPATSEAS